MTPSTSTTSRLLVLLSLLQLPREWPGSVLAERLEVSGRTVRRDVERLRAMGYRIHAERGSDGSYRLEAGSELPPLLLDDEQVIAVAVSLRAAAASGAEIEESAARALETIRRVLPPRLRIRLDALAFTTSDDIERSPAVPTELLIAVSTAIRTREVLRFDYATVPHPEPGDSPGPPRKVEPHHLIAHRGRWYLVAWDLDRDDWRIFRVDRMAPRDPGGRRFLPRDVPGGDVHRFLEARFRGATTPGAWPCTGTVVLHLPARDVVPFAGDGVVEDLGDGRCSLETGSWSWTALAASLGRFDAAVEVLRPAELRAAFADLAQRYAAAAATVPDAPRAPDLSDTRPG